jgi:hypothetical protein
MNGQAFPAAAVHHGEHAQFSPVKQVVGHKVHAPHLMMWLANVFGWRSCAALLRLGRL